LGIRERYTDVHFDRKARNGGTVVGIGTKLFDAAMDEALAFPAVYARCPLPDGASVLVAFKLFDQVTSGDQTASNTVASVLITGSQDPAAGRRGHSHALESSHGRRPARRSAGKCQSHSGTDRAAMLERASQAMEAAIPSMALTYTKATYSCARHLGGETPGN